MPIIEGLGWIAATFLPLYALPIHEPLNAFNDRFATAVDSGDSCWDRVGGVVGEYGDPSHYSLDPACNWRIETYETEGPVKQWRLVRDS